jgi:hypothetical protein
VGDGYAIALLPCLYFGYYELVNYYLRKGAMALGTGLVAALIAVFVSLID